MNRKPWEDLSPAYRRRLERAGITERQHRLGKSLVRARGHFHSRKTQRGLYELEKEVSTEWNRLRYRARKLAAYESIRNAVFKEEIISDRALLATVEFYESLELQYEEEGEQGNLYESEFAEWYRYMAQRYPREWLLPLLDLYYHGRVGR